MTVFGIISTCFYADNDSVVADNIKKLYLTKEDARIVAEQECRNECDNLNGDDINKMFRWDEDGSETYDYVVRLWDDTDCYRIVSGYTICEFEL